MDIEALLKEALSEIQRETTAPSQAENSQGEIQMSADTVAVVGTDREAVLRHVLSAS